MQFVYLAGPITGLSFGDAVDWRDWFAEQMPKGIAPMSPMRGKVYLEKERCIAHSYDDSVLSNPRAITTRDYFDVRRASLLVVNLLGAERVSIGTVMEIAWAKAFDVPVVLVMEKDGSNVHTHAMLTESIGFWVDNLEDAADLVKVILLPSSNRKAWNEE